MTLPRPLSHSSISLYQECPQRYKFKYVDNLPEKPKYFFSFGRSMHAALEFFYGVKALPAPSLDEVLKFYKENWASEGYRDKGQEAEYFENGKGILAGYYRRHIGSYSIPCFVEYNFQMDVDGVPVTGKVDRIDRLPDGKLSVLDYKTGKVLPASRVIEDSQLTMYQLACETLLGAEVGRLVFYHLPTHHEHAAGRRPQALLDELRSRIQKTAEAIEQGRFEPRPMERSCQWCDYKVLCPVFAGKTRTEADELSSLIDKYGEIEARLTQENQEASKLKASILDILRRKGYVRAFGSRYEVLRAGAEKFEFPPANKKKVLHKLEAAGLYDKILAPSAPLIGKILSDPSTDGELCSALKELGCRVELSELKVTPL